MPRVVLVCGDESERTMLQACLKGHDVAGVKCLKDAAKALTQAAPDVVLARLDTKNSTGMDVLRLMRKSQIQTPIIALVPLRGTPLEREAWQLGVRTYITMPIRYDDVRKAIEKVLADAKVADETDDVPPITDYERSENLSLLVDKLLADMKCPAGASRVLIRSVVKGINDKSEPRVCLRCSIRQAVGLSDYVYYEHIRDYCAGKPKKCEAVIQYKKLRKANG
jgi:CheY-like chemotaxis protein